MNTVAIMDNEAKYSYRRGYLHLRQLMDREPYANLMHMPESLASAYDIDISKKPKLAAKLGEVSRVLHFLRFDAEPPAVSGKAMTPKQLHHWVINNLRNGYALLDELAASLIKRLKAGEKLPSIKICDDLPEFERAFNIIYPNHMDFNEVDMHVEPEELLKVGDKPEYDDHALTPADEAISQHIMDYIAAKLGGERKAAPKNTPMAAHHPLGRGNR